MATLPPEYLALAHKVMRPDRPTLAAARDAARGLSEPREAWEALASRGVIPLDWVPDSRRRFPVPESIPYDQCDALVARDPLSGYADDFGPRSYLSHPPTID